MGLDRTVRSRPTRTTATLWLAALAASALCGHCVAASAAAQDLSALFGGRVVASARFGAPLLTGDFDGDGKPDAVYLASIRPASAPARLSPDVTVVGALFGQAPLGVRAEPLALAIVMGDGRKVLLTGYEGDGVQDYFSSPIWGAARAPISLARRGSKGFRAFQRQDKAIRNDVLVVGTEAGIDTALYWNGRRFALFTPNEEP